MFDKTTRDCYGVILSKHEDTFISAYQTFYLQPTALFIVLKMQKQKGYTFCILIISHIKFLVFSNMAMEHSVEK